MDQLITSLRRETNALLEKETCSITISIGLHLAITSQANAATNDISGQTYNLSITTTMPPMLMVFTMMVM